MSISIKYYRIRKAELINEIENLEEEINLAKHTAVDLYKMTLDLGIVFLNNADIYSDTTTTAYKILFGYFINVQTGDYICNGFLPASEISEINQWIRLNELQSFEGFSNMYNNLNTEARDEMEAAGSPDKNELYEGYVIHLVKFYEAAEKENNAVVRRGE